MKHHNANFLIVLLFVFPLFSCSHLLTSPLATSNAAQELLAEAAQRNSRLETFKGVGSVKLKKDGARHTARIMWAGDLLRQRIRMEVLELSGRPLVSMASGDETLNIYVHESQKYYTTKKNGTGLKRFLSVQIPMEELLVMLAGGYPIRQHQYAQLETCGESEHTCLMMKDEWGRTLEKMFWGAQRQNVEKIEFYAPSGELAYRVEFVGAKNISDYVFPKQIVISGKDGDGARLRFDQYLPDVALPDAMFDLKPPDNS